MKNCMVSKSVKVEHYDGLIVEVCTDGDGLGLVEMNFSDSVSEKVFARASIPTEMCGAISDALNEVARFIEVTES